MNLPARSAESPAVWSVGALCRAVADALDARFNPVSVRGEISGLNRAASGHMYFSIKDESGQLRCAMFRRSASGLDFAPRDGELVEVRGRLAVYEPRGDLQLIVEAMSRAGRGAMFEQFLQLKSRLEAEGLFDAGRKRALPPLPRGIGVVTSRGAAALHDVASALARRVPHIPVYISPAAVQGPGAAPELVAALRALWELGRRQPVDVILLVRGGGSIEDLWSFNDEPLARAIAASPIPVISGVGHETDFTIADFVADLRAPTPTAAAELAAQPRGVWLGALELMHERLRDASLTQIDSAGQRLDRASRRLGRPSARLTQQQTRLLALAQHMKFAVGQWRLGQEHRLAQARRDLPASMGRAIKLQREGLERASLRLQSLDPRAVLQRGYAWLTDEQGATITRSSQVQPGQAVQATLIDGKVDLTVTSRRDN